MKLAVAVLSLLAFAARDYSDDSLYSRAAVPTVGRRRAVNHPAQPCASLQTAGLRRFPVSLDNVRSLAPLGKLVPGDHTFPSPHIGVWAMGPSENARVPVFAPADMTITSLGIARTVTGESTYEDRYTITLETCGGVVQMYFHLITQLAHPSLVATLAGGCTPQGPGSQKFCSMQLQIPVRAGEQLGSVQSNFGLDIGFRDYRLPTGRSAFVNPARQCGPDPNTHVIYDRCFAACILDYLPAGTERDVLFSRLHDGTLQLSPTTESRCGNIYTDVAGTAQGIWYAAGSTDRYTEAPHLYLGPSTFTATAATFSIGTSATGLGPTGFLYFPAGGATVNPALHGHDRRRHVLFRDVLPRRMGSGDEDGPAPDVHDSSEALRAGHETGASKAGCRDVRRRAVDSQ